MTRRYLSASDVAGEQTPAFTLTIEQLRALVRNAIAQRLRVVEFVEYEESRDVKAEHSAGCGLVRRREP